jgi:hypothetical protein
MPESILKSSNKTNDRKKEKIPNIDLTNLLNLNSNKNSGENTQNIADVTKSGGKDKFEFVSPDNLVK